MKEINTFQLVKVPEGLEASIKTSVVTVKGPRGVLKKDFKHLALDVYMLNKKTIKVGHYFNINNFLSKHKCEGLVIVCQWQGRMHVGNMSIFEHPM